ncbi:MAG: hypothetical protein VR69_08555 [Peptococcaceae bacterium BRH_c4b]|nr:MAG: hypothetical protein VR69_08555 [Peptococcaceae bacterium BRH_c4b]
MLEEAEKVEEDYTARAIFSLRGVRVKATRKMMKRPILIILPMSDSDIYVYCRIENRLRPGTSFWGGRTWSIKL